MPQLGQRRPLSIPKVNKNPQVSQQRALPYQPPKVANRTPVATAPRTLATSTAQPSNTTVPATQSSPSDPFSSVSPTPAPTGGLFDAPSYTPAQGQQDPRDAEYWANLAKLKFSHEQEYASNLREQQSSDTAYGNALQTAIRNRTGQVRELGENAIRGNLGASGWLNRTEADQTGQYLQERSNAQLSKSEEDQARLAARNAIVQGFGVDAAGELAAAGSRYSQREREEAAAAPPEAALEQAASPGSQGYAPVGKEAGPFWGKNPPDAVKKALKKKGGR